MTHSYTLIWSFRNRIKELSKSIKTADANFPKHVSFLLVDAASSEESIKTIREIVASYDRKIRIIESPKRTSLSQAWNLGIMLCDTDFCIFSSSDVIFKSPKLFRRFELEYERTKNYYILAGNHAVFMLKRSITNVIGWFDENFIPGPHFDTDYLLRADEAGLIVSSIPSEDMYSHDETVEETILRGTTERKDRLPMHDFTNDKVFKDKWDCDWPGWADYTHTDDKPHPPNYMGLVRGRLQKEVDWHPSYTHENTTPGP